MVKVKMSDVEAGDTIEIDDGFSCRGAGKVLVEADKDGDLYFACALGHHFLEGQLDFENSDVLAGVVGHTPKVGS